MDSAGDQWLRITGSLLASLAVLFPAAWGAFALSYQLPGGQILRTAGIALWSAFSLGVIVALWQGRLGMGLAAFATAFIVMLIWWQRIPPSNQRVWADDVAEMTTGTVAGSKVTLHNVRNFDWRTSEDYTQRWDTRTYDLDHLRTVDMIMSYWAGPAIAHMLISFGFDGGQQVVFSVEIRREKDELFSEIGGFFKEFELSIIACDELDALRWRTNVRKENVFLYRLRLPKSAARSLFLGYVQEANALIDTPRFYNTITVNCTTLVYQMMRRIVGHLPLDYRLLFSGYMPEYVYKVRGLDPRFTLEELRARGAITVRGQQSGRSDSYSVDIRKGIPEIDPADLPLGTPVARFPSRAELETGGESG